MTRMWDRLRSECRHALRALRRRPGYAFACIATMALVLGANTALFAAVNATLFRPIPLRHGERLVRLLQLPPGVTDRRRSLQLNEASLIQFRQSRTVRDLVSYSIRDRVLHVDGEPYVVRAADASAGLLALSPSPVVLGRTYTEAEDVARAAVVVLGWTIWQQAFGGAEDVIGRTVQLDGAPFEVIGVLPRAFPPHFMDAQLWVPIGVGATVADGGAGRANLTTFGVLANGFTVAQADAEIARLMEEVSARLPAALADERAGVMSMREWLYGSYRAPFMVLAGSMLLLLVLACTNLAGLALAQVRARAGEMRLRRALGGTRAGIVRLVLLEVTILNAAGAAAGLVLAAALLPLLMRIDASAARTLGTVSLDWRVTAYAFASALLVSLVAAAVPGLLAGEGDAARDGESSGRLHGGRGRERWRGGLLIAQTAICLALLVSCGLLLNALQRSASISPGFDASGVLTAQLRLSPQRHATPEIRVRVVEDVLDRIRALPGVVDVATGLGDFVPGNAWVTTVSVEGLSSGDRRPHSVQLRRVTPAYFRTLRIPALQGRMFDDRDHLDSPPATIVSRTFVEQLLAGAEPLGRGIERSGRVWTIIGVVEDVADVNLVQPPEPTIYIPWHQSNTTNSPVALVIRTNGDPAALGPSLLRAVRELDPGLPIYGVQPLERFIADSLAPQRFRVALLAWLAAVGLILGAIGIAGLTAQTIGERMNELGVRLMLGAHRYQLCASAVALQLRRVAIGCAIGVALALAAGRMAAALLPELRGFDAAATLSAGAILLVAAAAAAAIPASRVLRLDPARILRR